MGHGAVARIVLGLVATLALAVIASHPSVKKISARLGMHAVASTGLPFLLLGAFFHLDAIGILTPNVLDHLSPAFEFGLGWIGFAVGMQFDLRRLDRLPRGIASAVAIEVAIPMLTVTVACVPVLLSLGVFPHHGLFRSVLVLCACAAASAPLDKSFAKTGPAARFLRDLTQQDEVVALALLGLVSVFFRPEAATVVWQLPKSAWLLVALGVGALLGIVAFVLLRGARKVSERIAILLGMVAFASGMAGSLALSVPVTCAMAGALLANLPIADDEGVRKILIDFEGPLYLVFLVIVGASWDPRPWQGWAIGAAFTVARVYGKALGGRLAARHIRGLPSPSVVASALLPQSPIAVVVMVAASMLHGQQSPEIVRWMVNAILVSAVFSEFIAFFVRRRVIEQAAA
jgi:Kef-type K+ transport system membrane component KefB